MHKKLTFENSYPVSADRLFALVSDLDTLEAVSKPWVQFHHLPSGQVHTGQKLDVALSLFGLLPVRPYRMHVVSCDTVTRRLRSEEDGMGVHKLTHEVEVNEDGEASVLIDRVDIDAGWLTPIVTVYAWIIYRWRHHIRLRLLQAP